MSGDQVWRWYSIPAPKGDPTFDEKAPNGWWGTWATKAEEHDLHRDIAKEKADSAKYADAWKRGGGGVWTTPAYDKDLNAIFVSVGNPSPDLDGSIRPGDNLYTDADRRHRRHQRQDQVVLSDRAARCLGPRRYVAPGGHHPGRQEGRGPRRQDRVGLRARRRHRQADPQDRQLHTAGKHVRPADREGHPDASGRQWRRRVVTDRDRSDARATPSWRACTSR